MKYTLNLDKNNYVLSIGHTKNDHYELDLKDIELEYLQAYRYINGSLVLDEAKKQAMIEEEEERRRREEAPTDFEKLEAQVLWTAVETNTLLDI